MGVSHLNTMKGVYTIMYTRRDWCLTAFPALLFAFICFLAVVVPIGDAIYPDVNTEMWNLGAEMVRTGEMPQAWPDGIKLDESETTQRIFCLRDWDGSWAKWVWSGGSTIPLDSGIGWFFYVAYGVVPGLLSILVGFGLACLIPEYWLERVLCA